MNEHDFLRFLDDFRGFSVGNFSTIFLLMVLAQFRFLGFQEVDEDLHVLPPTIPKKMLLGNHFLSFSFQSKTEQYSLVLAHF